MRKFLTDGRTSVGMGLAFLGLTIAFGIWIQRYDLQIIDEISSAYDLVWIDRSFAEIPDVDALLVIHPPELAEDQVNQQQLTDNAFEVC